MRTYTKSAGPSNRAGRTRMQRVDAIIDLALNDPKIARDQKLHGKLRDAIRAIALHPTARIHRKMLPTLYKRYRGTPFPLKQRNGRGVPDWRQLSPWMKVQIASLCLLEKGTVVFRAHLHEETEARLQSDEPDTLRKYFRDRIARCAREEFGVVPYFWFVIENRTQSGASVTRPHIHGEIEIIPCVDLPTTKNGSVMMRYSPPDRQMLHLRHERIPPCISAMYRILKTRIAESTRIFEFCAVRICWHRTQQGSPYFAATARAPFRSASGQASSR